MLEFTHTKDDVFKHEAKIKCLCVAFDGSFYKRIITIYVSSRSTIQTLLSRWNYGGATHKVVDGFKLPLYQYSLEG